MCRSSLEKTRSVNLYSSVKQLTRGSGLDAKSISATRDIGLEMEAEQERFLEET